MKKTIYLSLFLILSTVFSGFAQTGTPADDVKKSGEILNSLDTLMTLWYVKNATPAKNKRAMNTHGYRADEVPTFSDSVYAHRIRVMQSPLPLAYNATVKAFIDLYAVRKRQQVEKMLGLSATYFPIFEEALDRHKMPLELKYLSIVESALNPRADSRVHATGLWQFMFSTGKLYNLEINSFVDERKDPVKATEAAALLLKDLHGIFGDWFLAIAAYNCGPGNVNKAIRRSGGKRTFWEIYPYLPQETRGYVPAFIAAAYVFQYHQDHNLYPQELPLPKMVDTVLVYKEISFEPISRVLGISVDELKDLNPQYFRFIIPARDKIYTLRLPAAKAAVYASLKDSIYHTYTAMQAAQHPNVNPNDSSGIANLITSRGSSRGYDPTERVKYTVKAGETLSFIADMFDVSVYSIKRWNHIRRGNVSVGRRLVINVAADKARYYRKLNTMTSLQKKKEVFGRKYTDPKKQEVKVEPEKGTEETVTEEKPEQKKPTATGKGHKKPPVAEVVKKQPIVHTEYYTVQKGDTLWSIAQRFPGVSVDDIKRANNINNNHTIKVGQKIKIQKA
jgi:membrane-bound lytic murein transglycosylase D